MARPKKQINREEVEKLAAINCSVGEIAGFFGVNRRTIQRRFAAAIKKGRSHGRMSLKRRMWETAMSSGKGAVTMQIWLSKQMLKYKDRIKEQVDHTSNGETMNQTHVVVLPANGSEAVVENAIPQKK